MGPLQPRTTSVSVTTFVATTVVLVLWLLAIVAVALYLLHRRRHHTQRSQRMSSFNRSASYGNTVPPSNLTVLPSHPPRAQTPSHPPSGPSSLSATTGLTDLRSIRTTPPNTNPIPPSASTSIANFGRTPSVSPPRNPTSSAPSSNAARQQAFTASNTSQAALMARIQAVPLASDSTDTSADTFDPGREFVNPGYLAMLAQRGIAAREHALLGSDDSTDAGGGPGAALCYAIRARDMEPMGVRIDLGRQEGRFADRGARGRAMTLGQENRDCGLERPIEPLSVRKMPSV